ncbi:hypothetical protein EDB89DRAFT_1900644 [Lactarius sanguifluus]|nr:hypothetical protein EDB89DRAFT_1900644 [Lactarius sanguifluus]
MPGDCHFAYADWPAGWAKPRALATTPPPATARQHQQRRQCDDNNGATPVNHGNNGAMPDHRVMPATTRWQRQQRLGRRNNDNDDDGATPIDHGKRYPSTTITRRHINRATLTNDNNNMGKSGREVV